MLGALVTGCSPNPDLPEPSSAGISVPPPRSIAPPTDEQSDDDSAAEGGADSKRKPENPEGIEASARPDSASSLDRSRVSCPSSGTEVATAEELTAALAAAAPGDVILLRDGTYVGAFVTRASGSEQSPIWLCGGPGAVLAGEGIRSGYVLHLDHATHWRLVGFTVRDGQKGVMADATSWSVIQGLTVQSIGDEGIHLRRNSTDNRVIGNHITDTGLRRDKFGEGVYVGSAVSNWCSISDCQPDRSDRNVIADNTFGRTTSENLDIKEGTTGGLVTGNRFDGSGTHAADSWVDVKGTAWLIVHNTGVAAPLDGFQTHQILERWGSRNLFRGNTISAGEVPEELRGQAAEDGRFAFAFRPLADNQLTCDNTAAGLALANTTCHP